MQNKLAVFRKLLKKENISGFIIPSNDEFQSEYPPESAKRLKFISGFSGSAGTAVIMEKKAAFFTDGRYTLQAKVEVSKDFSIFNIADKTPEKWLEEQGGTLGFDPWLHTENYLKKFNIKTIPCPNLIDAIWSDKPSAPASEIFDYPVKYAGLSREEKIKSLQTELNKKNADAIIITAPDSLCWLLNIRASDTPCTPLLLAYGVVYQSGHVQVFADKKRLTKNFNPKNIEFINPKELSKIIKGLKGKVIVSPESAPIWFMDNLKCEIIREKDFCQLPKACKNKVEVKSIKEAHIHDGAAVVRFLKWLDESKEKKTELKIADKFLEIRKENKNFIYPSFDTIAGFKDNGAIVHYHADKNSSKDISGNGLLLVDSGGQYMQGTTDITRTIAIGKPTAEQKRSFTLVLKGHIALANAVFPIGTSGSALDILARQYLWAENLDFDHGTGHGVGCFLGVHEGPQRISKAPNNVALQEGMIISNEPGFYKEGEYGIRIENLVLVVKKSAKFLGFETITKAPIDKKLIDFKMLTHTEKKWLDDYHKDVVNSLKSKLNTDEIKWLNKII